jgi:hypothetical protein
MSSYTKFNDRFATNINQAVKSATDPVYRAQQEGRKQSGYSSGSAGGGVVHDYSNYNSNNTTTNKSGSGSGSGKGSSGSGSGGSVVSEPAFDWGAYYAELQAQAQARANEAYERNMARIASAYGAAYDSLKGNLDSTTDRLNAARDKSMGDVRSDAEDSLRQAYINNMMTRKNLNQRLSAMGMNGGATETTMSSLENQYGKSRSGINETLNKNISDLDMTYGDNLAAALQSFNSAKANLDLQRMQMENQAEAARQNAESSSMNAYMNIDSGYMSALKAALANQANYQYDPSQATNDFVAGNAQQAQSASEGTNYAKALQQAMLEATNNTVNGGTLAQLAGYNANTLAQLIAQLRQRGYNVG